MKGLDFGQVATNLTDTVTATDKEFTMIVARTDGTVSYTEEYESGLVAFTDEEIIAGQVMYGKFSLITATGHIVAYRG